MDNATFYAVEWKGEIIALFRDKLNAGWFASARHGAKVYPWAIPAETFEFEG